MSKYKSVKTLVDNIWFDSKREAARYEELKMLQRCGYVKNLELQVPFELIVNGRKICTYKADFTYVDVDGVSRVEDSKGVRTREYVLKRKLMEAIHGIRILET